MRDDLAPDELAAERIEKCAEVANCDFSEVVETLDKRARPNLAEPDAEDTRQIWEWWVACVLHCHYDHEDVEYWHGIYLSDKPSREGAQIRRQLAHGILPRLWRSRLERPEVNNSAPVCSGTVEGVDPPESIPEPEPEPEPAAVSGLSDGDLASRKTRISATDATAIMRTSLFRTPIDVWQSKQPDATPAEPHEGMLFGSLVEPALNERYKLWCASQGDPITDWQRNCPTLIGGRDLDWACATPDTVAVTKSGARRLVELKVTTKAPWEDPPEGYRDQMLWQYMIVKDLIDIDELHLAAMHIDYTYTFRVYPVPIDLERIREMATSCQDWYTSHLKGGSPPEVDATSDRELRLRYQRHTHTYKAMPAELRQLRPLLAKWYKREGQVKEALEILEGQYKQAIGEAEVVGFSDEDGWKVTWKKSKDQQKTDWEAVARELQPADVIVEKHTKNRPGSRVFNSRKRRLIK